MFDVQRINLISEPSTDRSAVDITLDILRRILEDDANDKFRPQTLPFGKIAELVSFHPYLRPTLIELGAKIGEVVTYTVTVIWLKENGTFERIYVKLQELDPESAESAAINYLQHHSNLGVACNDRLMMENIFY